MPYGKDYTSAQLDHARNVRIYRNGDRNYAGRKFVLNPKKVRSMDAFLQQVTDGIRAPFGAVRNIHTPTGGTRIDRLSDLKDGGTYVAAGARPYRKLNYEAIQPIKKTPSPMKKVFQWQWKGAAKSTGRGGAGRGQWKGCKFHFSAPQEAPRAIRVYPNGDASSPGHRFLLTKHMLYSFDNFLSVVTQKVQLTAGAVRRLYTLDGRLINNLGDLENNGEYVAVGHGRLKKMSYQPGGSPVLPRRKPERKLKLGEIPYRRSPSHSPERSFSRSSGYGRISVAKKRSSLEPNSARLDFNDTYTSPSKSPGLKSPKLPIKKGASLDAAKPHRVPPIMKETPKKAVVAPPVEDFPPEKRLILDRIEASLESSGNTSPGDLEPELEALPPIQSTKPAPAPAPAAVVPEPEPEREPVLDMGGPSVIPPIGGGGAPVAVAASAREVLSESPTFSDDELGQGGDPGYGAGEEFDVGGDVASEAASAMGQGDTLGEDELAGLMDQVDDVHRQQSQRAADEMVADAIRDSVVDEVVPTQAAAAAAAVDDSLEEAAVPEDPIAAQHEDEVFDEDELDLEVKLDEQNQVETVADDQGLVVEKPVDMRRTQEVAEEGDIEAEAAPDTMDPSVDPLGTPSPLSSRQASPVGDMIDDDGLIGDDADIVTLADPDPDEVVQQSIIASEEKGMAGEESDLEDELGEVVALTDHEGDDNSDIVEL